ncbi:MAG: tRNA preQ1(34) S-adenosylmethionine ribosyltransferase-isomerase QueA [Candidatus Eremiobacteraeota bacterium]|nr:tRNA preQ1(34) S-adenosylmethionine ribosyltransferase-isomerase QueA [Candidatus Eremiobacteraeota bacterium]
MAQHPAEPRDASRLMIVAEQRDSDVGFRDLPEYLRPGDVLVLNETRVIAARIFGSRPSGGRVEVLLLRPSHSVRYDPQAVRWQALVKPARRLTEGQRIDFGSLGHAVVAGVASDGIREIEFSLSVPFETFLERAGRLPLPPYIHNETEEAQQRYQTIFARAPGSVAAPTASLHFTEEVFERLRARGIEIVKLVLDVGLGTFRPMQTERLDDHHMHAESFTIPEDTTDAIARAKGEGRRIVAAGTTVLRALEGSASKHGSVRAGEDQTDIFITPGYRFRVVDLLITNFHLPQSTLLVLVCAFAGRERIFRAYEEAIRREYRFFSFGDAMLLERQDASENTGRL